MTLVVIAVYVSFHEFLNDAAVTEDTRMLNEYAARADADKAYRESLGLSPEQFIQLQQIQMQREVCGKEKSNCTFVSPETSAIVGLR